MQLQLINGYKTRLHTYMVKSYRLGLPFVSIIIKSAFFKSACGFLLPLSHSKISTYKSYQPLRNSTKTKDFRISLKLINEIHY